MFGSEDETELRLIRRGGYLRPDRNYDYFLLKRLMFAADLPQTRGVLLLDSQYDKILAVTGCTICVTEEEP